MVPLPPSKLFIFLPPLFHFHIMGDDPHIKVVFFFYGGLVHFLEWNRFNEQGLSFYQPFDAVVSVFFFLCCLYQEFPRYKRYNCSHSHYTQIETSGILVAMIRGKFHQIKNSNFEFSSSILSFDILWCFWGIPREWVQLVFDSICFIHSSCTRYKKTL